jgi:hypothetical protein
MEEDKVWWQQNWNNESRHPLGELGVKGKQQADHDLSLKAICNHINCFILLHRFRTSQLVQSAAL